MNYFTFGVDTVQIIMNIRNELYASIGYLKKHNDSNEKTYKCTPILIASRQLDPNFFINMFAYIPCRRRYLRTTKTITILAVYNKVSNFTFKLERIQDILFILKRLVLNILFYG